MIKALRVAVLSAVFILPVAPAFADPGGTDPPPPPPPGHNVSSGYLVASAILTALGV
jgi:hypothetical protein